GRVPPRDVVAEGVRLRLEQRAGRLEQLRDLRRSELGGHEMRAGAGRIGTETCSATVPSGRWACSKRPLRSDTRSLRRSPDLSSPSGGSSRPSLWSENSSRSSFQSRTTAI